MTYPKNGDRRLRETVKDLKSQVNQLRKENRMLREELENIMKPERPRKEHTEEKSSKTMTQEEWRIDFIRKHKPGLEKRLEELKNDKSKENEEKS